MNPFVTSDFILLISSVLLIFTACDAFCFLRTYVHLNITNQLGSGLDLTVQCKSRDDDLGVHVVPFVGYYTMIWRTTQFYCGMAWHGQVNSIGLIFSLLKGILIPVVTVLGEYFQKALVWLVILVSQKNTFAINGMARCFRNLVA